MKLNTTLNGKTLQYSPPKDHSGYSPTKDGEILGRFKYYQAAEDHGDGAIIMEYKDALERGLKHGNP